MFFTFKLYEQNSGMDLKDQLLDIQFIRGKILFGFKNYHIGEICEKGLLKNTKPGNILKETFIKTQSFEISSKVYKQDGDYIVLFADNQTIDEKYIEPLEELHLSCWCPKYAVCSDYAQVKAKVYGIDENIKTFDDFLENKFYNKFYNPQINLKEFGLKNSIGTISLFEKYFSDKDKKYLEDFLNKFIGSEKSINCFGLLDKDIDNEFVEFLNSLNYAEYIIDAGILLTDKYCIIISFFEWF